MDKVHFEEELDDNAVEAIFREKAMEALIKLNIPPFNDAGLELARSEKEITKCVFFIEEKDRKIKEREARREKRLNEEKESKNKKKPKDEENFKKVFKKAGGSKSSKKFKRRR